MDKTNANGALGGGLGKLLLRNLPSNYSYNSMYGLFPFYTPKTMSAALRNLGLDGQYALDRPVKAPPVISVNSWAGVTSVLGDFRTFSVAYGDNIRAMTDGYGCDTWVTPHTDNAHPFLSLRFFLAFDEPSKHIADLDLVSSSTSLAEVAGITDCNTIFSDAESTVPGQECFAWLCRVLWRHDRESDTREVVFARRPRLSVR